MIRTLLLSALGCLALFCVTPLQAAESHFYEMRVYYAAPGKLKALHARFRDHTMALFEKHGIVNIGYWTPVENDDNRLIYILGYPSKAAREASWKAFMNDPDWQKAYKASEVDGKLVDKVESTYMTATDYSPAIQPAVSGDSRVFELRVYTAAPDKLDALHARFRDHTIALFKKHGMTNIGYWTPAEGAKGYGHTLIYILAHKSQEAGLESFKSFRQDPDWVKAKAASEAGGSLTVPDGVKSTYMSATDYSPMR